MEMMNTDPDGSMPTDATHAAAADREHATSARIDPTWGWAIQDGKPIHVNEVARGLACECRCPECGGELIAKKGPLRAHHFAHHKQSTCAERGESALHEALKNVFARTRTLMLCEVRWDVQLPWWVYNEAAWNQARERLPPLKGTREARRVVFDEVQIEPTLGAIRPDATATKDARPLAIEFRVTNGVDEPKRREYERQKLSCIEVNASKIPRDASREAIDAFLRDTDAARHWIFHAPTYVRAKEAKARAEALWTSFPKRNVHGPHVNCPLPKRALLDNLPENGWRRAVARNARAGLAHSLYTCLESCRFCHGLRSTENAELVACMATREGTRELTRFPYSRH